MDDWDSTRHWREILERRLNQIGSQINGSQDFAADRLSDVMQQIEDLRTAVKKVEARQDKISDWVKTHFPKKDG